MVYGVSQGALGAYFIIPEEANGNGLLVTTRQIELEGQLQWAYIMLLPIALGCTKASFLFLYRRIFVVELVSKTNIFIVSIIVIDVLWMLGFSLAGLFECGTKFWAMQTYLQAFLDNCVDDLQLSLALAVSDLILDVIILLIPLPLIWRLHLTPDKKMAITGIFLVGLGTVAASVTRVLMTAKINAEGYGPEIDAIQLVSSFIYWGMVESGIAILVACLPTFWYYMKLVSWGGWYRDAKSSLATRGVLGSRRNRHSILADDEELAHAPSNGGQSSIRGQTMTYISGADESTQDLYPLDGIKVERDIRVERA
jgi:hypothetical protein